jgi:hypothetical protein
MKQTVKLSSEGQLRDIFDLQPTKLPAAFFEDALRESFGS